MATPLQLYINLCMDGKNLDFPAIEGFFDKQFIKKKTEILTAGQVCDFEAFVVTGCLKTFYMDQNGYEIVLNFATENWWISDLVSFQEETPSRFNISSLEDCELLVISKSKKEALLNQFPALERMFRLMVQKHLGSYQQRIYNNSALSAEERYNLFKSRFPNLLQRVPQYLIASYLGISPEFLSRIRKRSLR